MNPFAPLYARCNRGSGTDKLAGIASFPAIIDVELTNACNFGCLFCPTGTRAMQRKSGMMKAATMARIIDQCAERVRDGHRVGIRFIGWGEPLLHPGLCGFLRMASAKGILTHINTNGSKLDVDGGYPSGILIASGLSSIKFSFQGVDRKSYREARQTDFFATLVDRIAAFRRARDRHTDGERKPWIQVSTSTTYEDEEQLAQFLRLFEPLADEVAVGRTIFGFFDESRMHLRAEADYRLFHKLKRATAKDALAHPDPCPEVYDKLTIAWNGDVRVCCNDYDGHTNLGNVLQSTLPEIWQHPTIRQYRERLAEKDYSGPLCSVCYDYQGLTENGA